MLILVRHARPIVDPALPPAAWILAPEGRTGAAALRLPAGAYLVASDEPKAVQTLEPAGPVVQDARFAEVRRPAEPIDGAWRGPRLAYVEGADLAGWESRVEVVSRFDRAVADHEARAAGRDLVIASHGMAMTLWLTARIRLAAPGQFWANLALPDPYEVDLAAGTVMRLGGQSSARRRRSCP